MSGKKAEEPKPDNMRDDLKKIGLNFIVSNDMEIRVKYIDSAFAKIMELRELIGQTKRGQATGTFIEVIQTAKKMIHEIEVLLQKGSIPYGRGANQRWYAEMMKGWAKVLSEDTYGYLNGVEFDLIERQRAGVPEASSWNYLLWALDYLEIHPLECARMVASVSWDSLDVTTRMGAVIQTLIQDRGIKQVRATLPGANE